MRRRRVLLLHGEHRQMSKAGAIDREKCLQLPPNGIQGTTQGRPVEIVATAPFEEVDSGGRQGRIGRRQRPTCRRVALRSSPPAYSTVEWTLIGHWRSDSKQRRSLAAMSLERTGEIAKARQMLPEGAPIDQHVARQLCSDVAVRPSLVWLEVRLVRQVDGRVGEGLRQHSRGQADAQTKRRPGRRTSTERRSAAHRSDQSPTGWTVRQWANSSTLPAAAAMRPVGSFKFVR